MGNPFGVAEKECHKDALLMQDGLCCICQTENKNKECYK